MPTEGKQLIPGFETREREWRSTPLRYAVSGAGPPLVLVHGLGGTIANWRLLAPALAESRRVIVPDLPGHGGSAPLPAATHVDAFADAVLAVLEAEDALPAPWVGHSLGGLVGLRAAVRRPEAVRGVLVAAGAGISSSTRAAEATLAALALVQPGRALAPWRGRLSRSRTARRLTFGGWAVADTDALEPEAAEAFLSGPAEHTDTAAAGRALLASDPRADLDRVTCPVLCLWGTNDNWVPLADGMEYARRLRAPLRAIAGCGHLLIGERPDACLRAIADFLAELGEPN
ncbi:MAG TPA: alpha/beta fold hydrolase [Gaiellaceae bacterium]|nr:alpha/beta fold hydrolase [Gaiellaceae bacterium]